MTKSKKMTRMAILVQLLATLVLFSGCTLIEVSRLNSRDLTEFQVEGDRLYMAREINSRTLDQFMAVTEQHPEVKTLVFTVVPGSVDDEVNVELGRKVREMGLNTHLVTGGMIASGGVDLYLAGVRRTMEAGAYVGVHSWAGGLAQKGDSLKEDHPAHKLYLDYYADLGMTGDFYWFTLEAAPAGGMHWMTLEEVQHYQVVTGPLSETVDDGGPFRETLKELKEEIAGSVEPEDLPTPVAPAKP